jgi:hypothetical protein
MTLPWGRFSHLACLLGLTVAAAGAGAIGCGSVSPAAPDGGGGGGNGADAAAESATPVTTEQGCNQEAKALCDALDGCTPILVKLLYGDKTVCIARAVLSCTTDQSVAGITRTPADMVSCAQALATASCPDLLAGKYPEVCATKPGTVINGAACGSDWQCQSTYCVKTGACGVCGPRQASGGDCAVDGACQSGMVCASKKCVTPAGPGGDCNPPGLPCRGDLFCAKSAKCTAKVGVGGSCADTPAEACDFSKGAVCTGANQTTCEMANVAKGGEACGALTRTVCVGGLEPCSNFFLGGGICANPANDGEACGPAASGKKCIPPANCEMGLCRLPSAANCH